MGKNASKHRVHHEQENENEENDNREYHINPEHLATMMATREAWSSAPCSIVDLFQVCM